MGYAIFFKKIDSKNAEAVLRNKRRIAQIPICYRSGANSHLADLKKPDFSDTIF